MGSSHEFIADVTLMTHVFDGMDAIHETGDGDVRVGLIGGEGTLGLGRRGGHQLVNNNSYNSNSPSDYISEVI